MKALEISNLDQHLKPVQIDGVSTGLELSTTALRISTGELSIKNLEAETFSVDGDIDMNGSSTSINMSHGVAINSHTTAGDLTIYAKNVALIASSYDGDGDASDNDATLIVGSSDGYDPAIRLFNHTYLTWNIGSDADDSNVFKLDWNAVTGAATKLSLTSAGDLTVAGDVIAGDDVAVAATGKVSLDGIGGHTYIQESSADVLDLYAGGFNMLRLDEANGMNFLSGETRLLDKDGSEYSATDARSVQTKDQIDSAISAGAGGDIQVTTVTITEAEMNALHTTEKELVAAQGGSTVIIPLKVVFFADRDASTTQSGTGNMCVGMNGATATGAGLWGIIKRFMWNESGDRIIQMHQGIGDEVCQNLTDGNNRPLTAKQSLAITSGSIDSVKVVTAYYVYDNS